MAIKHIIICLLLIAIIASRKEIWVQYEIYQQEAKTLERYFHGEDYGYFVDLGGFNPVLYSNTVKFSNWNGVIVEANENRSTNIRDFQPHVTSLNFAVSNVSGEMGIFYEADFTQASSLSKQAIKGRQYIQQKVMVITMADLCHKYYKAKPQLLNIDVQGIGQIVLMGNDWSTDKCIPDVIFAEDDQPNAKAGFTNLTQVVTSHNYTKVARVKPSTLFIHNSKLQLYKKRAEDNQQQMKNKQMIHWKYFCGIFRIFLDKNFEVHFNSSSNEAYPFFRQLNVINVLQINRCSNLVSTIGQNRPIIIMQYDQKLSKIYLGTPKYIIQTIPVDKFHFTKIVADYNGTILKIFVLDHQKYDNFKVDILQYRQNPVQVKNYYAKTLNQFKNYLIFTISIIVLFIIVSIWAIQRRLISQKKENSEVEQDKYKNGHSPISAIQAEMKSFTDNYKSENSPSNKQGQMKSFAESQI